MSDKFQLPSLSPINISLTEGTQIPAPLDSPPETPLSPAPGRGPLSSHPTTPSLQASPLALPLSPSATGPDPTTQPLEKVETSKSANDAAAQSSPKPGNAAPGIQKRPSSVRRFLGLRTLGSSDSLRAKSEANGRPGSPYTTAQAAQATGGSGSEQERTPNKLKRKSSSGWFGSRRKSSVVLNRLEENGEKTQEPPEKKGPPPPSIPEFTALGTELDGGSLGADDMFKDIK